MAVSADRIEPIDQKVAVGDVALRVLRWGASADPEADADAAAGADADAAGQSLPPFLLVHGLASNARLWDGMARRLAAVGRGSVAVDLRGHGHSDKPDAGYDFETISTDLTKLIAALKLDRPIVAGQSWGAGVVLDLAVRRPDLVCGLVLVDGGLTSLRDGFPSWEACWERLAPPQLVGLPLDTIEGYFRTSHSDWPPEGIEGSLGNFEVRPDRTIAPWLSREHHKAILRAMWDQHTGDLWRGLRTPALIVPVDGGDSTWTAGKRAGVEMALAAARETGTPVRVEWFSGDHDIHAQRPEELASAILDAERSGLFGEVRVA
jgi:pimeloyl-ACP methyl ester carboxylesterase